MEIDKPYSGDKFIADVEDHWGGRLYVGVNPSYTDELADMRPVLSTATQNVREFLSKQRPPFFNVVDTGNVAYDFTRTTQRAMLHPQPAKNRLHLLADPFCRNLMMEGMEHFLRAGVSDRNSGSILDDNVPIGVETNPDDMFIVGTSGTNLKEHIQRIEFLKMGERLLMEDLSPAEWRYLVAEMRTEVNRYGRYVEQHAVDPESVPSIVAVTLEFARLKHMIKRYQLNRPMLPPGSTS